MIGEPIPPFIVKSLPGVKTLVQLVVDSGLLPFYLLNFITFKPNISFKIVKIAMKMIFSFLSDFSEFLAIKK